MNRITLSTILKYISIQLFIFTLYSNINLLEAQKGEKIAIQEIPFILSSDNNILVSCTLNQGDSLLLMLHMASNSVTLISEATKNIKGMDWVSTDNIQTWGGEAEGRVSINNAIRIGSLKWDSIQIWENERSGPGSDGKFGPNLFEDQIFEVDFERQLILIHDELPEYYDDYVKTKLRSDNGLMFIQGSTNLGENEYENQFLIHTGYGGSILFDDDFVELNELDQKLKVFDEKELKDSYGNIIKVRKALIPSFVLAGEVIHNVPVGFFQGSIGMQKMSVIGGDLIKRFNFIIDENREYIYLKQNSLFPLPFKDS